MNTQYFKDFNNIDFLFSGFSTLMLITFNQIMDK